MNELLTDSLFYEALNGIREWIDHAGVGTRLGEVQAKIIETENIVCSTEAYNIPYLWKPTCLPH